MASLRDLGPQSFTKNGFKVLITLRTTGDMKVKSPDDKVLVLWIFNSAKELLYMEKVAV